MQNFLDMLLFRYNISFMGILFMATKLLKTGEVAKLLNVSPQYVGQLAQSGELPCHVFGKRAYRFDESDILEYIEKTRRPRRKEEPLSEDEPLSENR